MIGIAIPAHNEVESIAAAVASAQRAGQHASLGGETVVVVVVADACSDATVAATTAMGARVLEVAHRNVGHARRVGAEFLLAQGARWLAFTDADSTVAQDWLVAQLALQSEAVCGCVWVHDWSAHGACAAQIARAFAHRYHPVDGHRHIHGANLGMTADAYRRAGGFLPLSSSEDVALVEALEAAGVGVAFSAAPRVWTSARVDPRAPLGFGDALRKMSGMLLPPSPPTAAA